MRSKRLPPREMAKRTLERAWQERSDVRTIRVEGSSMGAAVPNGSLVRVHFGLFHLVRRRDIYYIRRGENRIVHRIVLRLGPLCLEQGDTNLLPKFCLRQSILGAVETITTE